ncbi:putative phosphohydrolase [Erwinia phage Fifi067]|nr:putative phosphohydrolase [Erwinia phage Fifi067]
MDTLRDTVRWFNAAVPEPTIQNVNAQTGVHFEEVAEMLEQMVGTTPETYRLIQEAEAALKSLAKALKANGDHLLFEVTDNVLMLDALCDQIVTATGTGYMLGYLMVSGMQEVNRSNFSKFQDGVPVFDQNKKIVKGQEYFRADLAPFAAAPRF